MTEAVSCPDCLTVGWPDLVSGVSDASMKVADYLSKARFARKRTAQISSLPKAEVIVEDIHNRCREIGWDGEDAQPVTTAACIDALRLMEIIPSEVPIPEIVPEPTGDITLEWYQDQWHILTLTLGGDGMVVYSGLYGLDDRSHGVKPLQRSLQPELRRLINRVADEI